MLIYAGWADIGDLRWVVIKSYRAHGCPFVSLCGSSLCAGGAERRAVAGLCLVLTTNQQYETIFGMNQAEKLCAAHTRAHSCSYLHLNVCVCVVYHGTDS
jgi:hypothetical protein